MPFCHCLSHFSSWKPEFSWAVFCHAALICPQFVHHLLFILSLFYYFPPDALNSVLRGFNECIPHKIFLFYHCYLFQFASHYQLKGVASHGFILITPSVNASFFSFSKKQANSPEISSWTRFSSSSFKYSAYCQVCEFTCGVGSQKHPRDPNKPRVWHRAKKRKKQ